MFDALRCSRAAATRSKALALGDIRKLSCSVLVSVMGMNRHKAHLNVYNLYFIPLCWAELNFGDNNRRNKWRL